MTIIGNLPTTLANGTTADASQVMADLTYIVNQVNANARAANDNTFGSIICTGTITLGNSKPIYGTDTGGTLRELIYMSSDNYPSLVVSTGTHMRILNQAQNAEVFTCDNVGNIVAAGVITGTNITGSSDARLKKDWNELPEDFLELLAGVGCGTFTRISDEARSVGVPAQDLLGVLPEAVLEGPDGYLSVAYGNAALVAVIALTREVLRLRALVERK